MSNLLAASYLMLTSAIMPTKVSSPEQTLENYVNCLRIGSEQCVLNYYYGADSFYVAGPSQIEYKIIEKTKLTKADVDEWNNAGTIPKAEVGDIRLVALNKITAKSGDTYENNFYYYLRDYDGTWLIYTSFAEGV